MYQIEGKTNDNKQTLLLVMISYICCTSRWKFTTEQTDYDFVETL